MSEAAVPQPDLVEEPFAYRRELSFTVYGDPKPQGSPQHRFVPNLGRSIAHEKPSLKEWRRRVAMGAQAHVDSVLFDGAVELELTFLILRPKSAPKKRRYPTTQPDYDKLARSIGDALEKVLYRNDSQIVDAHVRKRYTLGAPGVHVVLREIAG